MVPLCLTALLCIIQYGRVSIRTAFPSFHPRVDPEVTDLLFCLSVTPDYLSLLCWWSTG